MLTAASQPRSERYVLMGVAGSGKTSVGEALSLATGIPYRDGDDLHPAGNVAKMSRGEPLTDEDRWPWLAKVGEALSHVPLIIGCSALKRRYRDLITIKASAPVTFIYLSGSRDLIAARMNARTGHFMPPSLLESQFAALQPPATDENAITVDIDQDLSAIVTAIISNPHF